MAVMVTWYADSVLQIENAVSSVAGVFHPDRSMFTRRVCEQRPAPFEVSVANANVPFAS